MKNRVEAVIDFANSKAFDIKEDIIRDLRSQINNPKDHDKFMQNIKEQMRILDYLENYSIEDIVWDWAYDYYEEEFNEDLE